MDIDALKGRLQREREALKEKGAHMVWSSETGPVGFGMIEAIISSLESQQQQIDGLRQQVDKLKRPGLSV